MLLLACASRRALLLSGDRSAGGGQRAELIPQTHVAVLGAQWSLV